MSEFTEIIPIPIDNLEQLAGLLAFWNQEVCKKEKGGKAAIYSVFLATEGPDKGKNLVWFKDTTTEPLVPTLKEFSTQLSDDARRKAIADAEIKEKLLNRSSAIVEMGGTNKWVALFDAEAATVPVGGFNKTLKEVSNRGRKRLPAFLQELVAWGKTAPDAVFAEQPGNDKDIYAAIVPELGPFTDAAHRRACLLEVMRVLAGFESSWDWEEGKDTNNPNENSASTDSAGAFQVSANSMDFGKDLKDLLAPFGITNANEHGIKFQECMKSDHTLALNYASRLMRHTRKHQGPLYKGKERDIFDDPRFRDPKESIYPWLSREAVAEFQSLLA